MSVSTRELLRRLDDMRVMLTASLAYDTVQKVKLNQVIVTIALYATVEVFGGTDLIEICEFRLLVSSDHREDDIYRALLGRIEKEIEGSEAIDVHKTRVQFLTPSIKGYI